MNNITHRGTPVKITIAFLCSFLFLAQARAVPLSTPTVEQVYPYLAGVCLNATALAGSVSGAAVDPDAQTITGEVSFQSFICKLRVHAGRGSGIRIVSGCAGCCLVGFGWDRDVSDTPGCGVQLLAAE